jgi:hypothetical protein
MNHTLILQIRVLGLTTQKRNTIGELQSDGDVQYLFRTIEDDPSQARLCATLSTV